MSWHGWDICCRPLTSSHTRNSPLWDVWVTAVGDTHWDTAVQGEF